MGFPAVRMPTKERPTNVGNAVDGCCVCKAKTVELGTGLRRNSEHCGNFSYSACFGMWGRAPTTGRGYATIKCSLRESAP